MSGWGSKIQHVIQHGQKKKKNKKKQKNSLYGLCDVAQVPWCLQALVSSSEKLGIMTVCTSQEVTGRNWNLGQGRS